MGKLLGADLYERETATQIMALLRDKNLSLAGLRFLGRLIQAEIEAREKERLKK